MLKIIGTSLIGIAHRRRGEALQDFFNAYIGNSQVSNHQEGNEWIKGWVMGGDSAFVFVADGAGSARHGRDGARYAVDSAVDFVRNNDLANKGPEEVLRVVLRIALDGIEHRAKELNANIEDLATTFMALYVRSHECFSVSVGDGYVIIDGGELKLLNEPVKGEYFNETQFITSPEVMRAIRDGTIEVGRDKCDAFVVATDGLWPTIIDGKPYEKFYRPIIDYLRNSSDIGKAVDELLNLLRSMQERYPSAYDDDLTMVVGAYE